MGIKFRPMRVIVTIALCVSQYAWSAPHVELDVNLAPGARTLSATALITIKTEQLTFYLADGFVLEAAEVEGATVPASRSVVDELQRFQIDLHPGTSAQTVKLRYHGGLQRLDDSMSHHDTLAALPAMASEQGSYLPGGSGWHPMLESDFTYRILVNVPDDQVAVAPGSVSGERTFDGIRHAVFSMLHPVESIDLMVGPWTIHERDVVVGESPVRLRTYFPPDASALSDGYLNAAHRFIERYSKSIGPYPFSEFSVVSSPIPTGFGMPTLTYLGNNVLHFPFIRDISLGHEVLHNWWGNGVRVDAVRGNWAEGLTAFMADYAYREDDGPDAAMRMRHGWLRDYAALSINTELPLSRFRARHHAASAAIGYGKAAMMFYALRARLGEDTFQKGIQLFWDKHKFTAADFEDLRTAFEDVAKLPLTDFFDQWLDRTGAPELNVADARMTGSGNNTKLKIRITQDDEPYALSLPFHVLVKNEQMDFRVDLSQSAQTFSLATRKKATSVQIDADFEVWRKLKPEEAPPILGDIIAAKTLQIVTTNQSLDESALALAIELSEGTPHLIQGNDAIDPVTPLLIVGSKSGCAAFLKNRSLGPRPDGISDGEIEVWIAPDLSRKIVVVATNTTPEDDQQLSILGRRLRHFGRYSWVSMEKGRAAKYGNWAVLSPKIAVPE